MKINFAISGNGKPLVLFHGWGFDSQIWQPLIADLNKNFQVYCVDLPGFGKSCLMDWQTFKIQLLTILPEEFAVLGWSLGGLYAIRLATEASPRISHLFVVAAAPCFYENEQWCGIKKSVLKEFHSTLMKDPVTALAHFQDLQLGKAHNILTKTPSKEALAAGLTALEHWDLRRALDGYIKPCCFIFGRLDAIIPVKLQAQIIERYPNCSFSTFRKSAHMPFLSEKMLFLTTLENFLL